MRIVGVLLAAGLSRRFGADDKLAASLGGVPVGLRAARALGAVDPVARVAVVGPTRLDFAAEGFEVHVNPDPAAGQAGSLAIGVAAARRLGADAVLVHLADMPLVEPAHLRALLSLYRDASSRAASVAGDLVSPPALFGSGWFDALEQLTGDRGARALLDGALLVPASDKQLADIDTPGDLHGLPYKDFS